MPDLKNLSFFSSSSRASPKKQDSRRLTRQRKLRHVTEEQLGLVPSLVSPVESPTPQPLPMPDFRRERECKQCISQRSKEGTSIRVGNRNDESVDITALFLDSHTSFVSDQFVGKTTSRPTEKSVKPPTYFRRGFPLNLDDESVSRNFKLNIAFKSAPATALSSPVRSSQRFNSIDCVPSCSSPKFIFPSTPRENVFKNGSNKLSEKICFQYINPQNVYPLPLPPSTPKKTQSAPSKNTFERVSSSKSQWIKGKLIGRGTYGTVFEAFNSETGAMCAMKEVDLMPDDPKSLECIQQLEQEIKILQQLKHKNIVQYYGCEVVGDHFCIYLEYVYPGSISTYICKHSGAIKESVLRNFTRHILSGLAYLHSMDTVHRDIKGANLLVDASGVVKLADFGLAKHLTPTAADLSLKGSPHWMAPELLQTVMGKDSNNKHAYAIDIWSLGCTVIEMFSGKPPWSENTWVQALFNVMNKSPAIPESLSSEGKDFLHRCFQRNPADRPQASQLLKHPFVRTTQEQAFPTCTLDVSEIKIADASYSSRGRTSICKSLPTSPCAQVRQPPSNRWRSKHGSSRAKSDRSPCSTLEAFSNITSPDFNRSPAIKLFTSSSNNLRFSTGYDYQNITRKARKGLSHSFEGL